MDLTDALDTVYQAITTVNEMRAAGDAIALAPEVILAGDGGTLDSLALVTLVLSIESRILDMSGRDVSLMDDREFDVQVSAFRTPATLAELIVRKTAS